MITIKDFSLHFQDFSLSIPFLSFPDKGLILIKGTNGSGKSSLFRSIMGFNTHYNGEIIIKDNPTNIIKKISYLPQISTTLPNITGEEYITQGLYLGGEDQTQLLIDSLNVSHLLSKSCASMSGGEKQLLTIVRALAIKKDIIILDEPDSFLSKSNKSLLVNLISTLSQNHLVIISSHQYELYHPTHSHEITETTDYNFYLEHSSLSTKI